MFNNYFVLETQNISKRQRYDYISFYMANFILHIFLITSIFVSFKFKMKQLIFLLLLFPVWIACQSSGSEPEESKPKEVVSFVYGENNFTIPAFSEAAEEEIKRWGIFRDFLEEVEAIYGSDYMKLRTHAENIRQYTDSVSNSIPNALKTKPVNSRLLVLKTRAGLLYESSHLSFIDTSNIQNSIRELNKATSNLIMEFNEKLQRDYIHNQRKEDEQKEMEKQSKFRDSVFQAERRDRENR